MQVECGKSTIAKNIDRAVKSGSGLVVSVPTNVKALQRTKRIVEGRELAWRNVAVVSAWEFETHLPGLLEVRKLCVVT